ncbi:MAG: DUF6449 domain-containing protein [Clostridia bacterium]|nr:DUF6449 domain-containing protein [Clostridia bacterium]
MLGYVNYIPDEDEIESVLIGDLAYEYDWEANKYDFLGHSKKPKALSKGFSSDEEYIKLTREYHKALIDNCDSSFMYLRDINKHNAARYYISDDLNLVNYRSERITYKLKNGKIIERSYDYDVYKTQEIESKVKSCKAYKEKQYNVILDILEGKTPDKHLTRFCLDTEIFGYDWQVVVTDEATIKDLLDAYFEDYFNSTYDPINQEAVLTANVQLVSNSEIDRMSKIWELDLNYTKEYDEAYGYATQYYGLPNIDSSYVNLIGKLKDYGWNYVLPSSQNLSEFRLYKINSAELKEEEQNGFSIGPISWTKCVAGTSIDESVLSKYEYITITDDNDMLAMTTLQNNICSDRGSSELSEEEQRYMDLNNTYIAYMIIKPEYVSNTSGYTELLRVSEDLIPGKYIAEFEAISK